MVKFRVGEYQELTTTPVINMNSFILGAGVGYKWNLSNKFVFGPYANVGRNFSKEVNDEFNTAVEFNAGFGIGYRF
jgi:outer membrane autotransporter protein